MAATTMTSRRPGHDRDLAAAEEEAPDVDKEH